MFNSSIQPDAFILPNNWDKIRKGEKNQREEKRKIETREKGKEKEKNNEECERVAKEFMDRQKQKVEPKNKTY